MFLKKFKRQDNSLHDYWQSYSDMMAALLLLFILVMASILLQSAKIYNEKLQEQQIAQEEINNQNSILREKEQQLTNQADILMEQQNRIDDQQRQIERLIGVKADIIEKLSQVFSQTNLSVAVDQSTGAIILDSNVLFDFNQSVLKPEGEEFLNEFLPIYCDVLMSDEFEVYISEIIIEGHTDTQGDYNYNLELSQKRALSVSKYALDIYTERNNEEQLSIFRKLLTTNGRSWSDPIFQSDGVTVDMDASRRVEFKFRLKDEEMISEMQKILEGE